jgi:hypothetical protein
MCLNKYVCVCARTCVWTEHHQISGVTACVNKIKYIKYSAAHDEHICNLFRNKTSR